MTRSMRVSFVRSEPSFCDFRVRAIVTPLLACAIAVIVSGCMGGDSPSLPSVSPNTNLTPPSNLVYSPSTVNDTLGTAMQADVPTVTGEVDSFTIAPALPLGLLLDAKSGAISGTPAAVSTALGYTVTAANSSGTTTAQITLGVNAGGKILLEQGHGNAIAAIRATATLSAGTLARSFGHSSSSSAT